MARNAGYRWRTAGRKKKAARPAATHWPEDARRYHVTRDGTVTAEGRVMRRDKRWTWEPRLQLRPHDVVVVQPQTPDSF